MATSQAATSRDTDFFRALLVGLTIGCPAEKDVNQCALRDGQSLSFDERVGWVESLPDQKVLDLYSVHHECFHADSKR